MFVIYRCLIFSSLASVVWLLSQSNQKPKKKSHGSYVDILYSTGDLPLQKWHMFQKSSAIYHFRMLLVLLHSDQLMHIPCCYSDCRKLVWHLSGLVA